MNTATLLNDIPSDLARAAYSGISFTPEKRADQTREDYAATLVSDYADLAKLITDKPEKQSTLDAEFARYREGYRTRYVKKLHSDSRCMSWMITGPANFPTARNEKRNRVAHKRLTELVEFRERALNAIRKTLCPELRPIMAGDSDAVERLKADIAEAEQLKDQMRAGIRKGRSKANINANIRRMKERLVVLERNKAKPDTQIDGANGIRFEDCPSDNRVRLFFPGKPEEAVRTRLKQNGFRWTPTLGCWQAYRKQWTFDFAKEMATEAKGVCAAL